VTPWDVALAWITALSLLALAACVLDKSRAVRGGPRIRERTLLLLALLGGSPGLLLAMLAVRHKTRKARFLLPLLGVLLAQGALLWLVLR